MTLPSLNLVMKFVTMNFFFLCPSIVLKYLILAVFCNFCFINIYFFEFVHGINVKPQKEKYVPDYQFYHNLSAVEMEVMNIATKYSDFVRLDESYRSQNGRPQLLIHLTNFTGSVPSPANAKGVPSKLKVLLSYGEHAREFLPVESMLYLLKNITNGISAKHGSYERKFTHMLLSQFDIFIIGVANPDGRAYVEKTHNYCWRGTSTGVDLDRNFDWEFGGKGSSKDPTDEEYRGKKPFSEPECQVFTEITSRYNFDAFISFHSGINQIYIPFADTKSRRIGRKPDNLEDIMDLASELSTATKIVYDYGLAYKLNEYTADGTAFDYMAGVKKIPYSLAIELWGTNHKDPSCFDLFNPPNEKLFSILQTIHPLYIRLFKFLVDWSEAKKQEQYIVNDDAPSLALGYILLILVIVLTVVMYIHRKFPFWRFQQRRRIVSLKSLSSTFSVSFMKS